MSTLKDITTVIWDVDQTLYPYWGKIAESFSFYTATLCKSYVRDTASPSLDSLIDIAKQSYIDHGLTTRTVAETYAIDEVKLYREHHRVMLRDIVRPQWDENVGIDRWLVDVFKKTSARKIRHIAFTHGTSEWGKEILKLRGLADFFDSVHGIDDYGLRLKNKDESLWKDFMRAAGIKKNEQGDYNHVLVVEDTPSNLIIPKKHLNMQTALIKTARHTARTPDIIDAVYCSATHVGTSILTCS